MYNERVFCLWVDDIRPMNFCTQMLHDYNCNSVKSVNQAKRAIENGEKMGCDRFIIDLDHDLGDFAFDGGDGYELVKWLIETERNTKNYVVQCHSMNVVGRNNILALYNRYFPPFDEDYFFEEREE